MALPCWAANDFSGDPNVVAFYKMEVADFDNPANNKLYDHSGNANVLSITGANADPTADTVNYKEGAASCYFNPAATTCWGYRTDGNLSSDFPLKVGYANPVAASVAFWFRAAALPTLGEQYIGLVAKYHSSNERSFMVLLFYNSGTPILGFWKGHTSGTASESTNHTTTISADQWYHVALTYNDTTGAVVFRVWDETAGTVLEVTDTHNEAISLEDTPFTLGVWGELSMQDLNFDGRLDEVVVFDDVLTADEIDEIRAGTYGAPAATGTSNWWWRRRHN